MGERTLEHVGIGGGNRTVVDEHLANARLAEHGHQPFTVVVPGDQVLDNPVHGGPLRGYRRLALAPTPGRLRVTQAQPGCVE